MKKSCGSERELFGALTNKSGDGVAHPDQYTQYHDVQRPGGITKVPGLERKKGREAITVAFGHIDGWVRSVIWHEIILSNFKF